MGTHSLTAEYLGATDYATSTSSALSQVVQANTLSVTADSISATAGTSTGSITVGTFTDNDPTLTSPSSFTATINWGDGTSSLGTITTGTGGAFNVAGVHTYSTIASFTTTVTVTDTYNSITNDGTNTATAANPVTLTNPGTQSNTEGDTVSLSITHTPSSGVTFTETGLPPGLTFNTGSGEITGTIPTNDAVYKPYVVDVSATNGTYSAQMSFTWNISAPITWTTTLANQSNYEGDTISLTTGASDSVSGSTVVYGAVGLPEGLKISTSTGTITGTMAAGTAANGPYTVTLMASDGTYAISQTFVWNVANPVTITRVLNQTTQEGASVSLAITANDASTGKTLVYTAFGLPDGLDISTSTGAITGTVAPGAAENGPYSVTVTAGDGTSTASINFLWTINSPVSITPPADQTSNEGDTVSLSISATDATSGTITYGATNLPPGLSISSSTGAITGTVASGASANGPYAVQLYATDGTYTDTQSFNWNIGVATTITIADPGSQSNNEGDTISLPMTATDTTSGATVTWSATGLPNGVSINATTGVISGTASAGGTWNPIITATDGTHNASVTDEWDVTSPITITDDGPQVYNAGDAVTVPITATDTAAGTLAFSSTTLPSGLSISSSTGTITGTLSSSLTPGNYTSTVSVTDGTNTAIDTFDWTIYGVSTIVVTNPGTQSSTEGTAISTLSIGTSYSGSGTLALCSRRPPGRPQDQPHDRPHHRHPRCGRCRLRPLYRAGDCYRRHRLRYPNIHLERGEPDHDFQHQRPDHDGRHDHQHAHGQCQRHERHRLFRPRPAHGPEDQPQHRCHYRHGRPGNRRRGPLHRDRDCRLGQLLRHARTSTGPSTAPSALARIADQTSTENSAISTLSVSATDSVSGATLSYSATGLPPGLEINPSTGAITGTPAIGMRRAWPLFRHHHGRGRYVFRNADSELDHQ